MVKKKEIVLNGGNTSAKAKILKENLIPYECASKDCNVKKTWKGKPLSLHLEHKNGNNSDNRLSNLEFLCPNCHSQTATYAGNKNKIKYNIRNKKVSDEKLVKTLKESKSIGEALKKVGMALANNYPRCRKLCEMYGIEFEKDRLFTKVNTCKHCRKYYKLNTRNKIFCSRKCSDEAKTKNTKRPPEKELRDVLKNNSYVSAGKEYGVADNTVRQWLKKYENAS